MENMAKVQCIQYDNVCIKPRSIYNEYTPIKIKIATIWEVEVG